ncbi:MAG: 2'-5' RNA ligase family protein [Micromonosporaceae bacterium]
MVADWLEVTAVRDATAAVAWPGPLPVQFSFVGHFDTGPFWLGVVVTRELIDLHQAFHDALNAAGVASWAHYLPGRWTPHSTLAMRVTDEQLAPASKLALAALPISGRIVAADIVRHTTTAAEYLPLSESMRRQDPVR